MSTGLGFREQAFNLRDELIDRPDRRRLPVVPAHQRADEIETSEDGLPELVVSTPSTVTKSEK